ncbi:MAG: hypothetical protein ACODAE_10650, partial [Gemmatimonadota bacterium]
MRWRRWVLRWSVLGLLSLPAAIAAQEDVPDAAPAIPTAGAAHQVGAGAGIEVHGLALGGLTVSDPPLHVVGGVMLQVGVGRIGALGLGMRGLGTLGSGRGGYESTLLGGALAVRLLRAGVLDLSAFGGYAHYGEVGWSGIERSAPGPLFGAVATIRAGSVAIGLAFTDLVSR